MADINGRIGGLIGRQGTCCQGFQPIAELPVGPALMGQADHVGNLLGAVIARRDRQIDVFVPAQDRLDGGNQGRLPGVIANLLVYLRHVVCHDVDLRLARDSNVQISSLTAASA